MSTRYRPGRPSVKQLVVALPWLLIAVGLALHLIVPQAESTPLGKVVVLGCLSVFFSILVVQLVLAARGSRQRRTPLMLLIAGLCLWAIGSSVLQAASATSAVTFPTPGETFFLLSYLGFAAFLITDVPSRRPASLAISLETAVVCGATICLASLVVLTPLAWAFPRGGAPLLLSLLYPLIDLMLATLVISQVMLGRRNWSVRTAQLLGGLLVLAAADSTFVLSLAKGMWDSSWWLDSLWGCALALIVTAARASPAEVSTSRRPVDRSRTLLAAAAIAIVVLVLNPSGVVGIGILAAALGTLLSAGARMYLALHQAREATDELLLARTDELTGLPNRRALLADVDEALGSSAPMALLLLDLDGFKDINDSVGHANGDALLIKVGDRLLHSFGHEMDVARLGGDEFAVLVQDSDSLRLMESAQRICAVISEPHTIDGLTLSVKASIGIAVSRPTDTRGTDLLRRADVAMYEAKAASSGALMYDPTQDSFSRDRLRRTEELRRAIRGGQLEVWYQPQMEASSQVISSLEALVRWRHPIDGLLSPIAFLPEARRHGMMNELSVEVMRMVVADARRWVAEGLDFRVAMNCAPPELLGTVLLPRLYETLAETPLPPEMLVIELTEDSFMTDPARARERLLELRQHHVQASIDDYGSGFSSLAYLRDLPAQELKLDRSFVSTILTDRRSRVIVDATRQLGHALGLRIVAEGVEDAATAAALVAMDVDVLQGFHVARPMPAQDVSSWVRAWIAAPASSPMLSAPGGDYR